MPHMRRAERRTSREDRKTVQSRAGMMSQAPSGPRLKAPFKAPGTILTVLLVAHPLVDSTKKRVRWV
jgi:hypothetical protein